MLAPVLDAKIKSWL